ncbi:MAG: hypothetical protein MRJ65_09680 [Candidatus Brocadiaceae bacterium]|nr:hypothetical protein [Candidatus Brocadiaceae bacterium]
MKQICLFEDNGYSHLFPHVYTRACFEIRCGLFSHLERTAKQYPDTSITLYSRDYLYDILQERYPYHVNTLPQEDETCLFLNGRMILTKPIPIEGPEEIGIQKNVILYMRLRGENRKNVSPDTFLSGILPQQLKNTIPIVNTELFLIDYFWDTVKQNKSQIERDFLSFVKEGCIFGKLYEGVYLLNKNQIYLGKDSRIKPCSVIDAENGPVYIGENVTIAPNTTIEGPAYIGNHSTIQAHAKLRGGTNIDEDCKIGGEVVNSIFHDYTNKQHDGFIGDSYIGSWVNLGASTVTSNLLNTYGTVKATINGNTVHTGLQYVGSSLGDHTKTAINTTIMTGSVIGFACNIVTPEYPPKYLPPFTWYSNNRIRAYRLEKALQVARNVMKRRKKEMTAIEEQLFERVFRITEKERNFRETPNKRDIPITERIR